jgi:hypothetical protein
MARGGKRSGAGRKAGTPTKSKAKMVAEAKASGIMPLDYLLQELRDESIPRKDRQAAAIAAAPYLHSKMPTAIVIPPPPSGPVSEDDERVLDLYLASLHDEADES